MQRFLILLLLGGSSLAQGQPQAGTSPFVDVPPCHWARAAVEAISRPDPNQRPQASVLLAENALRQVFEGLKCNDPVWSERFLQNPAPGFGQSEVGLRGFELSGLQTVVSGNQATIRFRLSALLNSTTLERSGTVRLLFTEQGWKVDYASLATLNLPLFPR
ncbi:MAG: hypothetical protein KatS3mg074_233 [Meiothermus sp.]|uniref:DUF3828 domain-containing protein n=2 Tax=Meiothermus hypogaeus TaxID=884155 RepID=A0A511R469_9DEIN|nr:hypothetical protein [Meiothermus hypogaeus]RIH76555.1 hypothetical protein Mhypo_02408 [Meiothermus hypogaeus]GEM84400.1 hypothetical protein MHY01S_25660 [Meiothermus hypogaeus NBRC 106114]GIW37835.1 MAG: hypothetical protein KatS3mg074_233 [Meiothermus sp.]